MSFTRRALCVFVFAASAVSAHAQWNPGAGQWGKMDASDLRVMTWNVEDALCTSQPKLEGANSWCALARIIAALKPDVLLLQETADNTGNGTGSGLDSVADLTTTIDRFLHGGTDPFNGNSAVTSWVQKYAPSYDLPHLFVSVESDGFNRNVILSRYPFLDLNGDTKSKNSDIPTVVATLYAPGGDGGIRGFMFAEVDLPAQYPGDLVVGCAHLKAGGPGADHDQRIEAAQNVAYAIRYWFNGNGGSVPDPANKVIDNPPATSVLSPQTPIVIGGDWNEDEFTNSTKGPAEWLSQAQTAGGNSDGTDRDGSDMTFDHALHFSTGSDNSHSSSKLDYLAWQDSIVSLRLSSLFISGSNPAGSQPPELSGYPSPSGASSTASDHRPIFTDLYFAFVDCNGNGIADALDVANSTSLDANANLVPDECECFAINYCVTSPNSAGPGATISNGGSLSLATNSFVLSVQGGPPDKTGLFLFGQNATQVPFGNGVRCVGSPFFRTPVVTLDLFGQVFYNVDFNNLPFGANIQAGESWRFQLWYRDPPAGGANVNLTDGLLAYFCP